MTMEITWLGHASFLLTTESGIKIVIDPFRIEERIEADIILITHEHYDHCSPEDVDKVRTEDTVIVCPHDCGMKLRTQTRTVIPNQRLSILGIDIEATPAYNLGKDFHPKDNGWVGYIIEDDNERIYHAGDTDLIPEMKNVKADIVLLPIGGTYTMTAEEAAEAVKLINPKVAIPMHYGSIVGDGNDADRFEKLCTCEVRRLD
jgi:L-ascorbate metabolism protein UlaG (beta-lactamase superfamily)